MPWRKPPWVKPQVSVNRLDLVRAEVGKVLVGQDALLQRLLLALLADGHVLLEGVPGLAKTLVVSTLAEAVECSFSPHPVHARPDTRET